MGRNEDFRRKAEHISNIFGGTLVENEKVVALADYLGLCPEEDVAGPEGLGGDEYRTPSGNTYRVLTDEEANNAVADYIRESLWGFLPGFLEDYTPDGVDADILSALQQSRCEDANPAFLALVGDKLDQLISDVIEADGRGHYLSDWDSEEDDLGHGYFAYRI